VVIQNSINHYNTLRIDGNGGLYYSVISRQKEEKQIFVWRIEYFFVPLHPLCANQAHCGHINLLINL
jgi:hypothetical protein